VTDNSTSPVLVCGHKRLDLSSPCIMGILNVTPDSFSDGGALGVTDSSGSVGFSVSVDKALSAAEQMMLDGAQIVDVGGESTRPGAPAVSVDTSSPAVIS
jgi:dihydropteroate synthase